MSPNIKLQHQYCKNNHTVRKYNKKYYLKV